MTKVMISLSLFALLAGCAGLPFLQRGPSAPPVVAEEGASAAQSGEGQQRPILRPVQSEATPSAASGPLGTTIASLGSPAETGLWLKTPLVAQTGPGRVQAASGASVNVTLIPIDGANTAGSRMSLQAMQALGLPLTDLAEVSVFAG